MNWKNTKDHYGVVAKALHWLIALLILIILLAGLLFTQVDSKSLRTTIIVFHKSLGLTIFALMIVRLFWRVINPQPMLPITMPRWQRMLAHGSHILFYVLIFTMIMVGWGMSAAGGHATYLWGLVNVSLPIAKNEMLAHLGGTVHLVLAWVITALIVFHVAGAWKHHLIDKDNTLRRMLPCGRD